MILWLATYLSEYQSGFNVFQYLTLRTILAVITALAISICIGRKGSQGLPGKNKMMINNNPLCFYPMNAAKNSKFITHRFLGSINLNITSILQINI